MNIRLIHSVMRRSRVRVMTIAAAAAVVAFGGGDASAQGSPSGMLTSAQWGPETQVVQASAVQTAADLGSPRMAPGSISHAVQSIVGDAADANYGQIQQVGFGCRSCNQPSCYGGCNSCGNFPLANPCGTPCDPYWYVNAEAVYVQRTGNDGYSLIRNQELDDFELQLAPRITIGSLPNCVNGYEFTFTGPIESDRYLVAADAANNLNTVLYGSDTDATDAIDPFTDASLQTLSYNSDYWSAELNRTMVGWDVAKVLFGGKFIRIEEDLIYTSEKQTAGSYADLTSRPENSIAALQAGLDLMYPVRPHLYTDFRGRVGAYINFAESNVRLSNTGNSLIHNVRDDEEFGGFFELGLGMRYQLGEILTIRAMGEMWYLSDVATATGQVDYSVSRYLGTKVEFDDIFYLGVSVGAELKF
ncbi:hypothetical protein [Rhodopirellula sp. MGV]|uniref:hypothetical protein n=1 Tax=Rhodopirellula sp. MGV TaxID=2023130 RepID=UPI000B96C205|nr:hypothetical protein [Rhodopirellula sp. MGV]OYP38492.1 hypothetical protein CGZ80_01700 [Rhodopirellula sp. MGV]PNY33504.1 hypothetical protein C2E31_28200 [Rhodopirellula baltica]